MSGTQHQNLKEMDAVLSAAGQRETHPELRGGAGVSWLRQPAASSLSLGDSNGSESGTLTGLVSLLLPRLVLQRSTGSMYFVLKRS